MSFSVLTLKNGLKVVLSQAINEQKTSINIFYKVGSANETEGNKGIAHLIEHMIFKGTKHLKEGDLDSIVYKLAGGCNAFTSYDYTGYNFEVPKENFLCILDIIADCMQHATFDQEFLNSELKTVIQELKMYQDDALSHLTDQLISALFSDGIYRDPIIGYKEDIWNKKTDDLLTFYKTYYNPNNAVLSICGNFDIKELEAYIKKTFEPIKNNSINSSAVKSNIDSLFSFNSKDITLFRDTQQIHFLMAWKIPGFSDKDFIYAELLSHILGSGKSSLLYQALVYEKNYASDVYTFLYDLNHNGILFIYIQIYDEKNIKKIINIIYKNIEKIIKKKIEDRFINQAKYNYVLEAAEVLEDNAKKAYHYGKKYLLTNEIIIEDVLLINNSIIVNKISILAKTFLKPFFNVTGKIVPLKKKDLVLLNKNNKKIDAKDKKILDSIIRNISINEPSKNNHPLFNIDIKKKESITIPNFLEKTLHNNLTIVAAYFDTEKIEIIIDFKAKHFYEDESDQGALNILFELIQEGTKQYPGSTFNQIIEEKGIDIECRAGQISLTCLKEFLDDALHFLFDMIMNPELLFTMFEKVKKQTYSDLYDLLDNSEAIGLDLLKKNLYKDHYNSRSSLGDLNSIKNIDLETVKKYYKKFITPDQTIFGCSSKINPEIIIQKIESIFNFWTGNKIDNSIESKSIIKHSFNEPITKQMHRDQVVLLIGGYSIKRMDSEYNSLLIADQIFSGGLLSNMRSRLFKIREEHGLFYTINGSLVYRCGRQEGLCMVKTLTSPSLVEKAESKIKETMKTFSNSIQDYEIDYAKNAIISSLSDMVAYPTSILSSLIFFKRYNLESNYFNNRIKTIYSIEKKEIIKNVDAILNQNFLKIYVGPSK